MRNSKLLLFQKCQTMNAKRFEIKVTPTFEMKEEMCRLACDLQDVEDKLHNTITRFYLLLILLW